MRKVIIISSIFMLCINVLQAQKLNQHITDTKTQKQILYGKCNIAGLQTGEFGDIYKMEYKYYTPDSITLHELKPLLNKIKIKIVMGSWCGDSQQQIPRFIKILNQLNYKTKKLDILCIDHYFKAKDFEKGTDKIEKVPTIIIYRKKTEIGRIIETPVKTLEKDLLGILTKLQ